MSDTECQSCKTAGITEPPFDPNNEVYGTRVPSGKVRVRWDRIIGATLVGALVGGLAVWGLTIATDTSDVSLPAATTEAPEYALTACATEDSTDCYWDASTQGNNTGTSFVNIDGVTYYSEMTLNAATGCSDALKAWADLSERNAFDMASQWAQGATYGEYVITDNIQPVSDRLAYILDTDCGH